MNQVVVWNGEGFSAPHPLPAQGLEAVGCATEAFCVAIDGLGDAFYFTGAAWLVGSNDWGSVAGISCVSATFCVSVGGGISMWNGRSWSEPQPFGLTSQLTGVSCPSLDSCEAVDATGQGATWNGTSWSGPTQITTSGASPAGMDAGDGDLAGVSCATNRFCVAVDVAGNADVTDTAGWSVHLVDPGGELSAVSCASTLFCVALDEAGNALIWR
jgi:hypothetical protein